MGYSIPITIERQDMETLSKGSREEAKQMIRKLFKQRGELDYIDITDALDLDLKMVVEICAELEEEGRIEAKVI